jgi:hypothetical protein
MADPADGNTSGMPSSGTFGLPAHADFREIMAASSAMLHMRNMRSN